MRKGKMMTPGLEKQIAVVVLNVVKREIHKMDDEWIDDMAGQAITELKNRFSRADLPDKVTETVYENISQLVDGFISSWAFGVFG